jgi:hypothetical protein
MTEMQMIFACALLIFLAFIFTFWPENDFGNPQEKTRLDYLFERKDRLFENLRFLNFEYRAGKYPEEDFLMRRSQLESEGKRLMAEIVDLQRQ